MDRQGTISAGRLRLRYRAPPAPVLAHSLCQVVTGKPFSLPGPSPRWRRPPTTPARCLRHRREHPANLAPRPVRFSPQKASAAVTLVNRVDMDGQGAIAAGRLRLRYPLRLPRRLLHSLRQVSRVSHSRSPARWCRPRTASARCQRPPRRAPRQPGSPPGPIFPSGSQRPRCPGQPSGYGRTGNHRRWSVASQLPALRRPLASHSRSLVPRPAGDGPEPIPPAASANPAPRLVRFSPQEASAPVALVNPGYGRAGSHRRWSGRLRLSYPRSAGLVGCPIPFATSSLVSHSHSPALGTRWRRPRTTSARCRKHPANPAPGPIRFSP